MEAEKGDLQRALEAEVESSKARDLVLQSSRKAEEASTRELAELRADYDQLSEVGAVEVKLLPFLGEQTDDDADKTLGGAADNGEEVDGEDLDEDEVAEDEAAGDEEAEDANLPEE
ncbi:unnamed protein product [Cochlearia groenlandica]